jgi:hypothetical protein
MTDMKTKAKAIMEAYYDVDTTEEDGIIALLREVVNQLQYQSFHHTEEYYQLDASDILELCEELKIPL